MALMEDESISYEELKKAFPFSAFMTVRLQDENDEALVNIFDCNDSKLDLIAKAKQYWAEIESIFSQVSRLVALETIRDEQQQLQYVVNSHAQFVLATSQYMVKNLRQI